MLRKKRNFNQGWQFYLGEVGPIKKTVTKAGSIGGFTATLKDEKKVEVGPGGEHFLKLIAQGDQEKGLQILAGTVLDAQLDENWQDVTLPHDWKATLPYVNRPELLMAGSKVDGVGYYRKAFEWTEEYQENQRIFLHFDGLMRMSDVWLNGCYLGQHISGYSAFELDITDFLKYQNEGENVLLVRLDTTTGSEGWWYDGAGIYRDVWVIHRPKLQISDQESYLSTLEIAENQAKIAYQLGVDNQEQLPQDCTVRLYFGNQEVACHPVCLASFEQRMIKGEFIYANPQLWSVSNPFLYDIKITLSVGEKVLDCVAFRYGIRTIAYLQDGFYLNHEHLELRGVCEHQDFGGIGVALPKDLLRYKLQRMKEMGVNAYRSSHHFASPDLLDLCDELGMIVMNENRLLETSEWRVKDLVQEITTTRNHPSLCFWSLGNEEVIGSTRLARRMVQNLIPRLKQLTKSALFVSAELLNPEGKMDLAYLEAFDVIGINYPESAVMGDSLKNMQQRYPQLKFMSTESASYFSTRGIYRDDATKAQCSNLGSAYSMIFPGERPLGEPGRGGTSTPENTLDFLAKHPELGGVFLWTAFDYCGEPSPFTYPAVSSQFGICDLAGIPKDYYYYYQAHWTTNPVLHIASHWNQEGLTIEEDHCVEIRVFTNCQTAQLWVNDQYYEAKSVVDGIVSWRVPFKEGEIKVIGHTKDNQTVVDRRFTHLYSLASVARKIIFESSKYRLIQLVALDENNKEMHHYFGEIPADILKEIPGKVISGNPYFEQKNGMDSTQFFAGSCVILQRVTE